MPTKLYLAFHWKFTGHWTKNAAFTPDSDLTPGNFTQNSEDGYSSNC